MHQNGLSNTVTRVNAIVVGRNLFILNKTKEKLKKKLYFLSKNCGEFCFSNINLNPGVVKQMILDMSAQ